MAETTRTAPQPSSSPTLSSDLEFDAAYDDKIRDLSGTALDSCPGCRPGGAAADPRRDPDPRRGLRSWEVLHRRRSFDRREFVGVERREHLVEISRRTALGFGAMRATFVHASADTFAFDGFDGIYLYNPFYEQISNHLIQIDNAIERSPLAYRRFVRGTMTKLASAPRPLAVVTFHGFGAPLPPEYTLIGDEPAGNDRLELWIKR